MANAIDTLRQPRIKILDELKDFSLEQLNEIPAGFNNNIIWNLGHMIATTQGVCYARAGVPKRVTEEFFTTFKPGTKPEKFYTEADLENIKTLLFSTLDELETDLKTDMFVNYPSFTTRYGITLDSVEDAIAFLPFHEGLHIGYIMSLRKVVKK